MANKCNRWKFKNPIKIFLWKQKESDKPLETGHAMAINLFTLMLMTLLIQFSLLSKKLESVKQKNKESFERKWNELEEKYR